MCKVPLIIERFIVEESRVICLMRVAPGFPRLTSPALAACAQAAFPDLPRHACVNDVGDTFGAVMDATSIPHLLEHLVIDLQTRAAPSDAATVYVGTTRWVDELAGRARIEVSFTDDLVALRAFRDATDFLNDAMVTCSP